jgi:hypothetical protein
VKFSGILPVFKKLSHSSREEIIIHPAVLHFYYRKLSRAKLGKHINSIEFFVLMLLVAFAFKHSVYFDIRFEQDGQKAFQYHEVGFLSQKPFGGIVKANVIYYFQMGNEGYEGPKPTAVK